MASHSCGATHIVVYGTTSLTFEVMTNDGKDTGSAKVELTTVEYLLDHDCNAALQEDTEDQVPLDSLVVSLLDGAVVRVAVRMIVTWRVVVLFEAVADSTPCELNEPDVVMLPPAIVLDDRTVADVVLLLCVAVSFRGRVSPNAEVRRVAIRSAREDPMKGSALMLIGTGAERMYLVPNEGAVPTVSSVHSLGSGRRKHTAAEEDAGTTLTFQSAAYSRSSSILLKPYSHTRPAPYPF